MSIADGGIFMVPLVVASIAAMALIVDRVYHLYFKYAISANKFVDDVAGRVESDDYRGAMMEVQGRGDHPMAEVLRAGLMKANRSDREIQRSMEEAMVRHAPRITKRTNYLAMLANVATLLGLLGTIYGLIMCFAGVADASAAEKQQVLADGISVAMFTTFAGLIVAIPCLVAYTVLHNRELALINTIEEGAITVFNRIASRNRDRVAAQQGANGHPQDRPSVARSYGNNRAFRTA